VKYAYKPYALDFLLAEIRMHKLADIWIVNLLVHGTCLD